MYVPSVNVFLKTFVQESLIPWPLLYVLPKNDKLYSVYPRITLANITLEAYDFQPP